jgi:HAD superfamily hydrolase (TIGR01509 family)
MDTMIPDTPRRPSALLFDLDGTLAETDSLHFEAFRRVFALVGRDLDIATYRRFISGRANVDAMRDLCPEAPEAERTAFADRKEALFRTMAGELKPLPGLGEVLAWAGRERVRLALVTSAPPENVEFVLKAFGMEETFDAVVLGEQLPRRKPDPMPYRIGLEKLGVASDDSVAFEDSPAGVRSAASAGIPTVGLTTGHDPDVLIAQGARIAIPDYTAPALWDLLQARA